MDKQRADGIVNHKINATPTEQAIALIWIEGYNAGRKDKSEEISDNEKKC